MKKTKEVIEDYIKEKSELAYGTIVYYKGYVCVVGDYNYDNDKESIVEIYKSKKDFKNGDYLENVSLNNYKLKQNIKDYIKEHYL